MQLIHIFFCCVFVAERVKRGLSILTNNVLTVISSQLVTPNDADVYYCQGLYGAQQSFRESAQVTVRGKYYFSINFLVGWHIHSILHNRCTATNPL